MLCRGSMLSDQDFFPQKPRPGPAKPLGDLVGTALCDVERYLIMGTLDKVGGNRTHAAQILGITSRTIRNKLHQYEAEPESQIQKLKDNVLEP